MKELGRRDLYFLTQCAISAAVQSGKLISDHVDTDVKVFQKEGGSSKASQLVTEVDHKSQEMILSILEPSVQYYDLAVLTEESQDNFERFEKSYFWCIDPLDGTLPFTEGRSGYSVSIALVSKGGESKIGVIYDPWNQDLYYAYESGGAFKNQSKIKLSPKPFDAFTWVMDRSFHYHNSYHEVHDLMVKHFHRDTEEVFVSIAHGGAAMNACWVLNNFPSCYFKLPKPQRGGGSLWDYAASSCIFKEAGGYHSDMEGKPLNLNQENPFMNECGILYASHSSIGNQLIKLFGNF